MLNTFFPAYFFTILHCLVTGCMIWSMNDAYLMHTYAFVQYDMLENVCNGSSNSQWKIYWFGKENGFVTAKKRHYGVVKNHNLGHSVKIGRSIWAMGDREKWTKQTYSIIWLDPTGNTKIPRFITTNFGKQQEHTDRINSAKSGCVLQWEFTLQTAWKLPLRISFTWPMWRGRVLLHWVWYMHLRMTVITNVCIYLHNLFNTGWHNERWCDSLFNS